MDATQLPAIRARVEAATLGPWIVRAWDRETPWPDECGRDRFVCSGELIDRRFHIKGGHVATVEWHVDDSEIADADFIAHARADIPALLAEVERLQAREVHFARVLRVPDGGEYLNDWDSRLTGLLDEVERLHTALANLVGSAKYDDATRMISVSVPFLEAARAALRTDHEEK